MVNPARLGAGEIHAQRLTRQPCPYLRSASTVVSLPPYNTPERYRRRRVRASCQVVLSLALLLSEVAVDLRIVD